MSETVRVGPSEKTWVAAIVDTRGRITSTTTIHRASAHLRLRVTNRNTRLIDRLCQLTGVEPSILASRQIDQTDRRGCVEHCPTAHIHTHTEMPVMAVWALTGAGAAVVLDNLRPFLLEDRGIDRIVDDVTRTLPKPGTRGAAAVVRSMNRLHGLGWDITEPFQPWLIPAA